MLSQSIQRKLTDCPVRRVMAALRPATPLALLLALTIAASTLSSPSAYADPVKGEIRASTAGGYARLVFTFTEEVPSDVRIVNGIVIIGFKKPVEVSVDSLATNAAGYVGVARRDPDGSAVRLALVRKVTVNSMVAAERLFVDLLPENLTGVAPGLPQEVVEELARRARDAERKARQVERTAQQKQIPPVRVRVGVQPTFTRYVFEMPEVIPVATDRDKDKLSLVFSAPVKFDLADAKAVLPPTLRGIDAAMGEDSASVTFAFASKADIRTFREDNNFIVDVGASESKAANAEPAPLKPGELPSLIVVPEDEKPAPPKPQEAAAAQPNEAAPSSAKPQEANASTPPPTEFPPVVALDDVAPRRAPSEATPQSAAVDVPMPSDEAGMPPLRDAGAPVVAELHRKGDAVQLIFPFAVPTPAAVFRRFDTLWLVFDTPSAIAVNALTNDQSKTIRGADVIRTREGQVVRIKLARPRLATAGVEGLNWTIELGDVVLAPTTPLTITHSAMGPGHASSVIAFDQPRRLHRLSDPEIGDSLFVVTALGPARGFLRGQDFVEFRALASVHGVAIQPLADDLTAEILSDKIVIARPNGLILSAVGGQKEVIAATPGYQPTLFNAESWGANRAAPFDKRQTELVIAAAMAPDDKRRFARLELARFYLGRELFPEARAVLDVALQDDKPKPDDASGLVLRAVANVMMDRGAEALKDLSSPVIGNRSDAALWRALAYARQGKWAEARADLKAAEATIALLPQELQRVVIKQALLAAIEVKDFAEASRLMNDFETLGITDGLKPAVSVLSGRLAEGLGRLSDALTAYRGAANSWDRPAVAEGRLREILLRYSLKEINRVAAINDLEMLTATWRGDNTEIEALQLLGRLYTEENRYRDAFYVMRTALSVRPNSAMTRRIQDETAATFDSLFLAGKGDALPAIEALSLFYDFRELMPIGRRGDEMIRRLADRLVSVDLLEQAAELLQHQVDHRLQGAARAQVASRLAVVYLLNRKPDLALQTLRATRSGDLNNDLRNQRLLLEARALSETGRHDVALEVVLGVEGREADRVRADVLWRARRWREAAEQIEKMYGERWRDFTPLGDTERPDILRAAIGFVLAEDSLGLARFREKYAGKMAEGPDAKSFQVATAPFASSGTEFRAIAKAAIGSDTLDQFLRDMRARYPETSAITPPSAAPAGTPGAQTAPVTPGDARQSSAQTPSAIPARTAAAR